MNFERGRQAVFTQQEVTEMQKGYRNILEEIDRRIIEIRNRSLSGFNPKDAIKGLQDKVEKEIKTINKDIEIEADNNQAI